MSKAKLSELSDVFSDAWVETEVQFISRGQKIPDMEFRRVFLKLHDKLLLERGVAYCDIKGCNYPPHNHPKDTSNIDRKDV